MQWGALTVTSQVTTLHATRFYFPCAKEATRNWKRVLISLMSQGQYRTRHAALQRLQRHRMPGVAALTFCSAQLVLRSQWFTAARSSNVNKIFEHTCLINCDAAQLHLAPVSAFFSSFSASLTSEPTCSCATAAGWSTQPYFTVILVNPF